MIIWKPRIKYTTTVTHAESLPVVIKEWQPWHMHDLQSYYYQLWIRNDNQLAVGVTIPNVPDLISCFLQSREGLRDDIYLYLYVPHSDQN